MSLRSVLLVLIFGAFAAFIALNWEVVNAPTTLSFGFWTAQAPLGLLLLGFTLLITAVFLLLLVVQQAAVLVETRRMTKELSAQRALADEAEASRFTALGKRLEDEMQRLDAQGAARDAALGSRLDRLEQALFSQFEQATNSLAAAVGELDDRVERIARLPGPGAG